MGNVYATVGPPGTGKTTAVAKMARNAVGKYGPRGVLICSLTHTAASEIGSRDTGVHPDMVGTLHAFCYRSIGKPPVLSRANVEKWNADHPQWALSGVGDGTNVVDPTEKARCRGDDLYRQANVYRSQMRDEKLWPDSAKRFDEAFREFRRQRQVVDFVDMIELAHERSPFAPGSPAVLFVDEAQDISRLERAVVDAWAISARETILVGDPDQALHAFRGASQDVLDTDTKPRILAQSWRVPRLPHEVACSILKPFGDYRPTPEDGTVRRDAPSLRELGSHIAEALKAAEAGDRTMFLCSSGGQVAKVTKALRALGVPYHNPYTPRWNPLGGGDRDVTTTVDRMKSFLRPKLYEEEWTIPDLKRWAEVVACGDAGMRRGAKKVLEELDGSEDATAVAREVLQPDAWTWTQSFDLERFVSHTTATFQKAAAYPLKVAKMRGLDALIDEPKICVGTCHSTKGGESERVVVFPDLPMPFWEQWQKAGWEHRDSIRRMFYVACTRTRRDLIIARPAGRLFVEI